MIRPRTNRSKTARSGQEGSLHDRMLRALDRHGPLSPMELPRGWPTTRLHALRALRELEEQGLVERGDNGSDVPVRLTRTGRRRIEIADWERAIRLAGLDDEYGPV